MSRRGVVYVDQSPMNPVRWCLTLACRHEIWVTAKRRPMTKVVDCKECDTQEAPDDR